MSTKVKERNGPYKHHKVDGTTWWQDERKQEILYMWPSGDDSNNLQVYCLFYCFHDISSEASLLALLGMDKILAQRIKIRSSCKVASLFLRIVLTSSHVSSRGL